MNNILSEISDQLPPEAQELLKTNEGIFSSLTPMYLFLSLLMSVIGFVYFRYGKRREEPLTKYLGIVLMFFPYFVTNTWVMAGVGLLLCALPFILRQIYRS